MYTVGLPSADCLGRCRPAKTCLLLRTASRSGASAWQRAVIIISGLSTNESPVSSVHGVCKPTVKMDKRTLPSFLALMLLAVVGKRYLFYLYCCWLGQMIDLLIASIHLCVSASLSSPAVSVYRRHCWLFVA